MKIYFIVLLALCAFCLSPITAQAAEIIPVKPVPSNLKTDDVQHLVDTLSNDASRQDFIRNLKLLLETQKTNEAPEPLTEQLGMRSVLGKFIGDYESFLNKYALSSSLVHQVIGSFLVIGLSFVLYLGVRRMTFRILKLVDSVSEKIGFHLSRLGIYTQVLQITLKIIILGLSVYTLGKIWDIVMIDEVFSSAVMRHLLSTFITFLFVAFLAALIWESVGVYLSYVLKQADDHNQTRVKTLLPIVRNIVMSVFAVLFGLILLSELGINVGPLIAGAGVIGVAIGFGAQSMVKDFLTGFTIVLEDIIRVGDVATLGGCTGVVERITLRKVQLRDTAGIVYTIPFSAISIIQNQTKDYSFYVMDIGVGYETDIDHATRILQKIDDSMRADAMFGPSMLAPIEIFGLDRFGDSAVIIKARLKTIPLQQWNVGREYNRRLKLAFDKEGISIPFPQRTITVRHEGAIAAE